jgi:hypothetical protein
MLLLTIFLHGAAKGMDNGSSCLPLPHVITKLKRRWSSGMKKKSSNACFSFAGILPDSFCTQQVPSPLIFPYFLFSLFTFLRFFCLFLPSNRSLLQETTHSAKQPALGSVCHPSLKRLRGSKLRRAVGHALIVYVTIAHALVCLVLLDDVTNLLGTWQRVTYVHA